MLIAGSIAAVVSSFGLQGVAGMVNNATDWCKIVDVEYQMVEQSYRFASALATGSALATAG